MAPSPPMHHLTSLFLFLLLVATSPLLLVIAQPNVNIILGSSLTTQGPNTAWLSPSSDFAFGFRPLESNDTLFLLAIWFENTPNKTVAWSASLDSPAAAGSTLALTASGQLSLSDPTGKVIWGADSNQSAAYATMQDTGNFRLVAPDGTTSWQSFDSPTDTILPTQALQFNNALFSRLTDTDYAPGRFTLAMQSDGNLVLYLIAVPTMVRYHAYWASNTVGAGKQLVFESSGDINLQLANGSQTIIPAGAIKAADYYQRATLDPDGIFRQYSYPKNKTANGSWAGGWSVVSFLQSDICNSLRTGIGSGVCGFNSYCQLGADSMLDCQCPPKYSFLDQSRKYKGCKPDFAIQSCDADESGLYEFEELIDTNWPDADYEHYSPRTEGECKALCLNDCFCAVAIFGDGSCWKKRLPLSNGRSGNTAGGKALIKVLKANATLPPQPAQTIVVVKKDKKTLETIVGSSLLGSSVLVNFVLLMIFYCSSCRGKQKLRQETSMSGLSLKSFTYEELKEATKGFREELGRGASSIVYKGFLAATMGSTMMPIAVKKLEKIYEESEKEFAAEVHSIGQTHHKNLVRLLGFCDDGPSRLLVYEFMSNGSLTGFLFGNKKPEWNQRVRIIMGIARGLLYLHEECSNQIIHCDIKHQNILLDDNLVARISDFGLAKLLGADQTRTCTQIRGTKGYVAPEWFTQRPITAKVDVYSFGVLLLEIICCRKNLEYEQGNDPAAVLVYWAYDCFHEGRLDLLIPDDGEPMADMRRVERFMMVAIWCIQEEPSLRPSMHKVTQMLEGSVTVPVPPDPSSYMSSIQ